MSNKIILYIATSLDGFIADKNGSVDWLPHPKNDDDLEVVGYNNLMSRIDRILMGKKSFEQIVTFGAWGWPDKKTYVFSYEPIETPYECIARTQKSPLEFVAMMKKEHPNGQDIWLLGGGELARSFAHDELIDEVIITLVPQSLGEGIPLGISFDAFDLIGEKKLMDGMVQYHYKRQA